jgi:hypothetical protein
VDTQAVVALVIGAFILCGLGGWIWSRFRPPAPLRGRERDWCGPPPSGSRTRKTDEHGD